MCENEKNEMHLYSSFRRNRKIILSKLGRKMICFQFSCLFRKVKKQFKRYFEETAHTLYTAQALQDERLFCLRQNPDWLYFTSYGSLIKVRHKITLKQKKKETQGVHTVPIAGTHQKYGG